MSEKREADNLESLLDDALADFVQPEAQQKGFREIQRWKQLFVDQVYSVKYQHELTSSEVKNKKTLKGESKTDVKKDIDHKDFVHALETNEKRSNFARS